MKHKFCVFCKCNECKQSCNCGICYDGQDSKQRISCDRVEYKEMYSNVDEKKDTKE